jgi:hypothetical protein
MAFSQTSKGILPPGAALRLPQATMSDGFQPSESAKDSPSNTSRPQNQPFPRKFAVADGRKFAKLKVRICSHVTHSKGRNSHNTWSPNSWVTEGSALTSSGIGPRVIGETNRLISAVTGWHKQFKSR